MNTRLECALALALAWTMVGSVAAQSRNSDAYRENRAVIVVTGIRLNEDPESYSSDVSVAEDALVEVTAADGTVRSKRTEKLLRPSSKGAGAQFTADFTVDLDATYSIAMTFKNGTVIRIEDYTLPESWKTHFYYHGTTGTLSPASIMRFSEDPQSHLRCYVYAVYPLANYHKLGGRQL